MTPGVLRARPGICRLCRPVPGVCQVPAKSGSHGLARQVESVAAWGPPLPAAPQASTAAIAPVLSQAAGIFDKPLGEFLFLMSPHWPGHVVSARAQTYGALMA